MRKKLAKLLIVALVLGLFPISAGSVEVKKPLRVGLCYNTTAVTVGSLENVQGTGYAFGYYDTDRNFVKLGETQETKVSVMRTWNVYLTSGGAYTEGSSGSVGVVGAYHVALPGSYADFESAKAVADTVTDGFVTWIAGTYSVRRGSYASYAAAQAAVDTSGIEGAVVGETSAYGYSAVITGTTRILFQFDADVAGEEGAFGVQPGLEPGVKAVTAFKGEKFYGGFRFERINSVYSTVVNMVNIEDYVKGVIPYEMSPSWPLEALKAQSVAARTYAARKMQMQSSNGHSRNYHFDICTSTDCQVYHGLGIANDTTNRAVEETAGKMAYYKGQLIEAVYSSSHGGASEDVKNVWGTDHPYLKGVIDPYEADVADIAGNYKWTKTFTPAELKDRLQRIGKVSVNGDIVNFTTKKSELGNVISFTVTDTSGKNYTISRENVRSVLGTNSIRFDLTVSGGGGTAGYTIAERGDAVNDLTTQYAISGDGTVAAISGDAYAITADGVTKLEPSSGVSAGMGGDVVYTLTGTGWGHSVGMSQWGAYAMAKRGMSYLDILHFYYTDITVE